jgi:MFS transporter, BCD family, chlorophyll transporter
MLLIGMMLASFAIGNLLHNFTATRLVQVIQGAAVLTMVLNITALWKQEARNRVLTDRAQPVPRFTDMWAAFTARPDAARLLLAIGTGALAFAMQDALLEPYGGEILGLTVGSTTALTGVWALGALTAFALSARRLAGGSDPLRLAGLGAVVGIAAFLMALFAAPLAAPTLLFAGAAGIGFGTGLFSVGTMIAAMGLAQRGGTGLALGAWGAVQASGAGLGIALGGLIRDGVAYAAVHQALGAALADRATGYLLVYGLEIALLLVALVVLGPVIGLRRARGDGEQQRFGLSEFPT